jgi:hypothetical protein
MSLMSKSTQVSVIAVIVLALPGLGFDGSSSRVDCQQQPDYQNSGPDLKSGDITGRGICKVSEPNLKENTENGWKIFGPLPAKSNHVGKTETEISSGQIESSLITSPRDFSTAQWFPSLLMVRSTFVFGGALDTVAFPNDISSLAKTEPWRRTKFPTGLYYEFGTKRQQTDSLFCLKRHESTAPAPSYLDCLGNKRILNLGDFGDNY